MLYPNPEIVIFFCISLYIKFRCIMMLLFFIITSLILQNGNSDKICLQFFEHKRFLMKTYHNFIIVIYVCYKQLKLHSYEKDSHREPGSVGGVNNAVFILFA
jgi:hypothetical protein